MTAADRTAHDRWLWLAASTIDFELTPGEVEELQVHLATCPACARTAAAMRADATALGRPLELLPSRRVDEVVAAAIARRPVRPQRNVLLAAAALLLLAILGAVVVGAYLRRSAEDLQTSLVPSDPPVVQASDPAPSPPVVVDTWETLEFEAGSAASLVPGRFITASTFDGTDLVGVGRGGCPDAVDPPACYVSAWTAAPGGPWVGASDQPGLAVGPGSPVGQHVTGIVDIAAGPAGLVAVGFDVNPLPSSCAVAPCTSGPGVWRSVDGQNWERAHIDLGPGIVDRFSFPVAAIAAGPRGYVMVGYTQTLAPNGSDGQAHAVAWTSPDGIAWTRAADSAEMDVGPCLEGPATPECGGMRAVVTTPDGYIAVGRARTGRSPGDIRPAAWTSPDGLTWARADGGLDFNGWLAGVTVAGPRLVAVGGMCEQDCFTSTVVGMAATSRDGSSWTAVPVPDAADFSAVAYPGGPIFAVGLHTRVGSEGPTDLQLWRSNDGVVWEPVTGLPTPSDVSVYQSVDITASPSRVVIAGWLQDDVAFDFRNYSYSSPPR
jgi:hypothetical protein